MKKIICLISFLLTTAFTLFAQENVKALLQDLKDLESRKIIVVAHRGDWRNAPENSLQAFQNCIEMGVDMIEIDVRKTKDGQLVLMHDNTVDRTTDGKGEVSDLTLEELRQLHLKNGMGRVTFHHIPTLEEVLELTKGKILINIDKGYDYFQDIYDLLVKTNTLDQVIIKSTHPYKKVKNENNDILDKVIYMPNINLNNPEAEQIIDEYTSIKPVAFECNFAEVTPKVLELLQKIKDNGSKIWLNSLWPSQNAGHDDDRAVELKEPDESWGWLLEQGASLIQTDRPYNLIQYLQKKGRR